MPKDNMAYRDPKKKRGLYGDGKNASGGGSMGKHKGGMGGKKMGGKQGQGRMSTGSKY